MPLHAIIGHAGSGGASGGSGGGGDSDGGRTAAAATVVTAIVPAAVAAAAAAVPIMVLRLHSIYVGYVSGRARRRSWCCACTVYMSNNQPRTGHGVQRPRPRPRRRPRATVSLSPRASARARAPRTRQDVPTVPRLAASESGFGMASIYEQQPATDQPRSTPATAGGPKPATDQPRTYFRYKACLRRAAGDGGSYSVPLCLAAMFAPWTATCGGPTIVLHARLNVEKTISVL